MKRNFELHMKLYDMVEEEGLSLSGTAGGSGFPDYFINLTEDLSLGLTVNPIFHKKPFRIYPNGNDVSFEEIREILSEQN